MRFIEYFINEHKELLEQPNVPQAQAVPPPAPGAQASPEKNQQKRVQMGKRAAAWINRVQKLSSNAMREMQSGNLGTAATQYFTLLSNMSKEDWYKFFFRM